MGARIAGYPLVPEAPSLVADRRSLRVLAAKLADWRPHAVLAYGPRSMLLGAIAARRAGVPRIVLLVTRLAGELATDRPSWRWRRLALKAAPDRAK